MNNARMEMGEMVTSREGRERGGFEDHIVRADQVEADATWQVGLVKGLPSASMMPLLLGARQPLYARRAQLSEGWKKYRETPEQ